MKKCRNCKEPFTPIRTSLEKYCKKTECVRAWIYEENEKEWKRNKAVFHMFRYKLKGLTVI